AVGDRNKFPARHAGNDGGKERVPEQHGRERGSEQPGKIFASGRADLVADRADDVITAEDEEVENESKPKRADFVRANIDNLVEDAVYFCCLCHAARTSASCSGVTPAFKWDCRSCDCALNQASVSRAVSTSGRNVSPFAIARLLLTWLPPASSPRGGIQTGISDHGPTFCCSRKSVFTHFRFSFVLCVSLMAFTISQLDARRYVCYSIIV